jgi:DNA-binding NtrC family response regulator
MANAKVVFFSDSPKASDQIISGLKQSDWQFKSLGLDDLMTVLPLEDPDCVILHLDNSEKSAQGFISEIHGYDDNVPVIVISEKSEIEDAVLMMKEGAYDFFSASIDVEKIIISINNAIRLYKLTKRVYLLEQQAGWKGKFDDIVGHSAKMQEVFQLISMVAKSNATVLILGESGTGKELVAKAIHRHSARAKKSFIDINCGAIPRELLENELFGHEKGSYTGADRRYIGSCERAHKGTLFLDEICEMEQALQVKLLRLLQERDLSRVGGTEKISVDLRFIAATNRDILESVNKGEFREDLYYRLNVIPIQIPPLRARTEDILLIANYFLEKLSTKNEKMFVDIAPDAAQCMLQYDWPGNVRELENFIERIVVLNNDSQVKLKHFPPNMLEASKKMSRQEKSVSPMHVGTSQKVIPLELVEKYAIEAALDKCCGNVGETAKQLQIGQATLYRKIKQFGLRPK